jgi:uncharacterized protein (TIGR00661 family)
MAKIIYGVAGEGFGHSSRSHLIGQRLIDAGHDVMFVGSQKSLVYLKQYFGPRVREIFGLSFAYENGKVDPLETFKQNLRKLPDANQQNDELFKKYFEPFAPDLVISDFEPFSAWWAWRNNVPFLSIDHEHMLTLCKLEHKAKNWFSRMTASVVTECYYVGAVSYIVINFFKVPLRISSAVLAPPIVRPDVTTLKPRTDEHILLYSTTGNGIEELTELLAGFRKQKFIVYGFDLDKSQANCTFKKRSTDAFLADLASARGIIASAGFSLISECLYLRKPMCLLPLAGQYEQIINAHYIEKLQLGVCSDKLDAPTISRFIEKTSSPMSNHPDILWPDNDAFFRLLQSELNKLDTPMSIDIKR